MTHHANSQDLSIGELHTLLLTGQAMGQEQNQDRICFWAVDAAISLLGCSMAAIILPSNVNRRVPVVHAKIGDAPISSNVADDLATLASEAWPSAEGSGGIEALDASDLPDSLVRDGINHLARTPIRTIETEIGVLVVGTEGTWIPSVQGRYILTTLSNQAAVSLESARLRREASERAERNAILNRIIRATTSTLDIAGVFRLLSTEVKTLFPYHRTMIALADPGGKSATVFATAGKTGTMEAGTVVPFENSVLGKVISTRVPFFSDDIENEEEFLEKKELISMGIRSNIILPLWDGESCFGALAFGRAEIGKFEPSELELAEEVARQVGVGLTNARLYKTARDSEAEARELAHENALMVEIGKIISSSLEIEEVYDRFADQVQELVPFDRITISEVDFEANTLTPVYVSGLEIPEWPLGEPYALSSSRLASVATVRERLVYDSDSTEFYSKESPGVAAGAKAGLRSGVAVPLIARDRVIGTLDLSSMHTNAYNEKHVRLMDQVAAQISGAFANAQLYAAHKRADQVMQDMAVLEERNRIARDIHDSIAQGLTGIIWQLNALERQAQGSDKVVLESVDRVRNLARESLQEARRSVGDLRAGPLQGLTLVEALRQEVAKVAAGNDDIETAVEVSGEERVIPSGTETAILRICQESLANIMKYSDAKKVRVSVIYEDSMILLSVADDGVGFDPDAPVAANDNGGGFGLISMRERARLLGGEFSVSSSKGRGTLVEVKLPLK